MESNVTEIQGQMSELMSMMRQLTQTKTAGAGQHEEESGGTERGAAHNPRSGAGRVPPTAVTGYGVTGVGAGRRGGAAAVEATAAREFTVHNRAASEPAWSALVTLTCLKRRGHSDLPDSPSKHSSPAKAAAAAVRDEVATAGAGEDRAAAAAEVAAVE